VKEKWAEGRKGRKNPMYGVTPKHAKLSPDEVRQIRDMLACGLKCRAIACYFDFGKNDLSTYSTKPLSFSASDMVLTPAMWTMK